MSAELDHAREELRAAQERLLASPGDPRAQIVAYQALEAGLRAAGLARKEEAPDEEVRALLRDAARAGVAVFELAGTLEARVTILETGEEERFIDTSAANQWTYARAVYAAAAAGDGESLERLAELDLEALRYGDQVVVTPALDAVAIALHAAATGTLDNRSAGALVDEYSAGGNGGADYWLAQLEALAAMNDEPAFERALERVAAAERGYYGDGSPEAELLLPVLGLRALAARHAA